MIYLLSSQKRRQWLIFDAESPFWPKKREKCGDLPNIWTLLRNVAKYAKIKG